MTTISIERSGRSSAPTSARHAAQELVHFLRLQRNTLAASFRAARAYEHADSIDAQRQVLGRFTVHLRS